MISAAWVINYFKVETVNINLTIVGIFDMPLFVITIIYGLAWRRTNWQGAIGGFIGGGLCAASCYYFTRINIPAGYMLYAEYIRLHGTFAQIAFKAGLYINPSTMETYDPVSVARKIAPIVGCAGALVFTPIITLLTPRSKDDRANVFNNMKANADDGDASPFNLVPTSTLGKLGALTVIVGFAVFLIGVFGGGQGLPAANTLAIAGMIAVFAGGITRVYAP